MKLSENIDKIIWSILDKAWYVIYGFVAILQMRRLEPETLGLYALLISIHTWAFIIADSFFLNSVIQFGFNSEKERQANSYSLIFTFILIFFANSLFYFPQAFWCKIFKEPNFYKVAITLPLLTIVTIPKVFSIKICLKHSWMFKLFLIDSIFFGSMTVLTVFFFFQFKRFTFELIFNIYLTGTILSSLIGVLIVSKNVRFGFRGSLSIKEFFEFGLPVFSFSFFQSIPKQMDILLLQYFFQSRLVGIYYSAKTLFRFFEEGVNAAAGLVYPTAVRLTAKNKKSELNPLLSKSISFLFISIFICFVFLELGGSKFFIKFVLPSKYQSAIPLFNLMLIATIFMPFQLFASALIAEGKQLIVAKFIFLSALLYLIFVTILGFLELFYLVPLGIIAYYICLFLFLFPYGKSLYHFKIADLLRAYSDIKNYFKSFKN